MKHPRKENQDLIRSLMCHDQITNPKHTLLKSLEMARWAIDLVTDFMHENPQVFPAQVKGPMKKGKGKRKGCK